MSLVRCPCIGTFDEDCEGRLVWVPIVLDPNCSYHREEAA